MLPLGAAKVCMLVISLFSLIAPRIAWAILPEVEDYSIAAVESGLKPDAKVGSLRMGVLCFPKGTLFWKDIARPSDTIAIAILTQRLGILGLPVAELPDPLFADVPKSTKYRVRVTYQSLAMKVCVPGLGIGEKKASGKGIVTLRWQTFDRLTRTQTDDQMFDVPIALDGRDIRKDTSIIREALRKSAQAYVLARRSPGATSP